jgi:hypothetical protein
MLQAQATRQRALASLGWLAALAIGALVAAINIYAGGLLLLLTLLALVGVALMQARPAAGSSASRALPIAPAAQQIVFTAEGAELPAIVVPAESAGGYRTVLTSTGYHLVNDAGQIVYTLGR